MINIKPCPFCGGYAHVDYTYSHFRDTVIYCEGCDCVFALDALDKSAEEIGEAWNRRIGHAEMQALS